jgi:hypothetical protein
MIQKTIVIDKEYMKAIQSLRRNHYYNYSTKKIIECLINDYLTRENGRLGKIRGGVYEEKLY